MPPAVVAPIQGVAADALALKATRSNSYALAGASPLIVADVIEDEYVLIRTGCPFSNSYKLYPVASPAAVQLKLTCVVDIVLPVKLSGADTPPAVAALIQGVAAVSVPSLVTRPNSYAVADAKPLIVAEVVAEEYTLIRTGCPFSSSYRLYPTAPLAAVQLRLS